MSFDLLDAVVKISPSTSLFAFTGFSILELRFLSLAGDNQSKPKVTFNINHAEVNRVLAQSKLHYFDVSSFF